MGYQERGYMREPGGGGNPLMWLLTGSLPLFTVVGIRVRMHASMLIFIALTLLFGGGIFSGGSDRLIGMSVLFTIVLMHEFGHALSCRAVGGEADEIIMHPLGGLALCAPPRRPLPSFITTAGGPAVNVVLLGICAIGMYVMGGRPSWNPFGDWRAVWPESQESWAVFRWFYWLFVMNYGLLLFNLIPSFPLDGGRMLQEILWKPMGYYRSMLVASGIGIAGAVGMMVLGLMRGQLLLMFVGVMCIQMCLSIRRQLKAAGPWAFQEEETDYSAAQWKPEKVAAGGGGGRTGASEKAARKEADRAAREAAEERAEQEKIDKILEKVSQHGMHSLNFMEKRALKTATEKQRQRTLRRSGRAGR